MKDVPKFFTLWPLNLSSFKNGALNLRTLTNLQIPISQYEVGGQSPIHGTLLKV